MLWDVASIILETGMRPEEVCDIQPGDVHLDQNYLDIPRGKTTAAKRRVSFTQTVERKLAARVAECKGFYLFPHDDDLNH